MTSAPVSVQIMFFFPPDQFVPATDAAGLDRSRLEDIQTQEGCLLITCGETEVTMTDALLWMVPGLCFDGPVALQAGGTYVLDLWTTDEQITLRRDGDEIEMTGVYQSTVRFPAAALQHALFEAGEGFVRLAASLWPDRPENEVQYLTGRMESARAALAG